jgi:hypothetical protein
MKFNEWLSEVEIYSTREERFKEDALFTDAEHRVQIMKKWLEAAYNMGYDHGYDERELDEILSEAANRGRYG